MQPLPQILEDTTICIAYSMLLHGRKNVIASAAVNPWVPFVWNAYQQPPNSRCAQRLASRVLDILKEQVARYLHASMLITLL